MQDKHGRQGNERQEPTFGGRLEPTFGDFPNIDVPKNNQHVHTDGLPLFETGNFSADADVRTMSAQERESQAHLQAQAQAQAVAQAAAQAHLQAQAQAQAVAQAAAQAQAQQYAAKQAAAQQATAAQAAARHDAMQASPKAKSAKQSSAATASASSQNPSARPKTTKRKATPQPAASVVENSENENESKRGASFLDNLKLKAAEVKQAFDDKRAAFAEARAAKSVMAKASADESDAEPSADDDEVRSTKRGARKAATAAAVGAAASGGGRGGRGGSGLGAGSVETGSSAGSGSGGDGEDEVQGNFLYQWSERRRMRKERKAKEKSDRAAGLIPPLTIWQKIGRFFRFCMSLGIKLAIVGFGLCTLLFIYFDAIVYSGYEVDDKWVLPAVVYSRPLELYPDQRLSLDQMVYELKMLQYREVTSPKKPGEYAVNKKTGRVVLIKRPFKFPDADEQRMAAMVEFDGKRVNRILNAETLQELAFMRMDPVLLDRINRINPEEDRIFISVDAVPQQLITTLIEIEDRAYYDHFGINPLGIIRAAVKNAIAGRVVEGGSTITQQLHTNPPRGGLEGHKYLLPQLKGPH